MFVHYINLTITTAYNNIAISVVKYIHDFCKLQNNHKIFAIKIFL